MRLLITWLINALALLALPYMFTSIQVDAFRDGADRRAGARPHQHADPAAARAADAAGDAADAGLFIFVINGLLFWFVGSFIGGFHVDGFWAGVFGAIVYSLISWALSSLILARRVVDRDVASAAALQPRVLSAAHDEGVDEAARGARASSRS